MEKSKLVAAEIERIYGIRLILPRSPVALAKPDLKGSEERRYEWQVLRPDDLWRAKLMGTIP